jgi:oligopeptide transport system permease protein
MKPDLVVRPRFALSEADALPPALGYWARSWRRLLRNRLAVAGLAIVGLFALLALLAPVIAPHDPSEQDLRNTFASPSWTHLMGTDNLGRDWFSRVLYGARLSMTIGVFTQAIILTVALPIGLTAGYFGRAADNLLMRLTDLAYAFPDLLLIILLRSVLGGSIFTLFLIIGLVSWMDMARLLRGQVLSLKEREFVEAARSLGATHREVLLRHILPNAIGPVIVVLTFGIPRAIFIEASLSFIGFGVASGAPSWGSMVQEGYSAIFAFPHLVLFPSGAIALLMLAFTFLGDGLRDALDPRSAVSTPRSDAEQVERKQTSGEATEARAA